ncbi:fatty acid-binding protein homolog 9 [Neodiprion lecontei]|uniref:Fatty acid-binding protein homolog 9 n=1 Tax=Neodiprion lecontei TaxID=441921 RepID=A0A6J0B4H2_NEOLC|nr:fatty acid-binding protein homolog 9 [Neodiprion lecontei]
MVQIVGKYQHVVSSPEFADYLKAVGGDDARIGLLLKSNPSITISEAGGKWTVTVGNEGKESSSVFKLGEPYDEVLPQGATLKSVTKREGDKFITESTVPDGRRGLRTYEFTDAGITVHLVDEKSGVKATRTYKRV